MTYEAVTSQKKEPPGQALEVVLTWGALRSAAGVAAAAAGRDPIRVTIRASSLTFYGASTGIACFSDVPLTGGQNLPDDTALNLSFDAALFDGNAFTSEAMNEETKIVLRLPASLTSRSAPPDHSEPSTLSVEVNDTKVCWPVTFDSDAVSLEMPAASETGSVIAPDVLAKALSIVKPFIDRNEKQPWRTAITVFNKRAIAGLRNVRCVKNPELGGIDLCVHAPQASALIKVLRAMDQTKTRLSQEQDHHVLSCPHAICLADRREGPSQHAVFSRLLEVPAKVFVIDARTFHESLTRLLQQQEKRTGLVTLALPQAGEKEMSFAIDLEDERATAKTYCPVDEVETGITLKSNNLHLEHEILSNLGIFDSTGNVEIRVQKASVIVTEQSHKTIVWSGLAMTKDDMEIFIDQA